MRAIHWTGCVAVWATTLASPTRADDWPQFLGPARNGVSAETGLTNSFPTSGPPRVWSVPGGVGMSGLAVADGLAVTLVQKDQRQFALALDARRGTTRWQTEIAEAYRNQMGNGPRATPTIAGERVFVYSGQGVLAALRVADGRILWRVDLVRDQQAKPAEYGMASSPLVVDERVIVTVGGEKGTLVACDVNSGKVLWTAGTDSAAYSSPSLRRIDGQRRVIAFHGGGLEALDPATGSSAWRYEFQTDYDCNIALPVLTRHGLLISAGENHGCVMLKPTATGLEPVWSSLGTKSVLRCEWQTPLLLNGFLYGMDNVGSAGPVTHLTCIEAASGRRRWQETRFGKGNLIAADGKLLILTMKGELVLVEATPESYRELGRAEVCGNTRQAPSLANGLLYVRDDRRITCLDLKKR